MPAMNEAEIYQKLIKDGDSMGAIKKNTEMLRQHFAIESQRVAHSLIQLDPNNRERHEADAQRILHENNEALTRVLTEIVSTSPQKMPIVIEGINKASEVTKVPKNQAKAVLSFPIVLFAALPAAIWYAFVSFIGILAVFVVALLANQFTLKIDLEEYLVTLRGLDKILLAKVWIVGCYIVAVIRGFMIVRRGGTIREMFNELFSKSLVELLSDGSGSGGKR